MLVVGCSGGSLRLFDTAGVLRFCTIMHAAPLIRLKVRTGTWAVRSPPAVTACSRCADCAPAAQVAHAPAVAAGSRCPSADEEGPLTEEEATDPAMPVLQGRQLWALHADGTLVTAPLRALQRACRRVAAAGGSGILPDASFGSPVDGHARSILYDEPPPFSKWQLKGQHEARDVTWYCCRAPPLFQAHAPPLRLAALVVGANHAVVQYEVVEEAEVPDIGQLASAVASRLTSAVSSAVTSLRWGWWRAGAKAAPAGTPRPADAGDAADAGLPSALEARARTAGPSASVRSFVSDQKRRVLSAETAPGGRLVATVDDLGRVMLMDAPDGVVLRMWKGYRQAQVAWLHALERWPGQAEGAAPPRTLRHGTWGLYLVILAPLRNALQIWRMPHGPLVSNMAAPGPAVLLRNSVGHADAPVRCFLLRRRARSVPATAIAPPGADDEAPADHGLCDVCEVTPMARTVARTLHYVARSADQREVHGLHGFLDALTQCRRDPLATGAVLREPGQSSQPGSPDCDAALDCAEGQALLMLSRLRSPHVLRAATTALVDPSARFRETLLLAAFRKCAAALATALEAADREPAGPPPPHTSPDAAVSAPAPAKYAAHDAALHLRAALREELAAVRRLSDIAHAFTLLQSARQESEESRAGDALRAKLLARLQSKDACLAAAASADEDGSAVGIAATLFDSPIGCEIRAWLRAQRPMNSMHAEEARALWDVPRCGSDLSCAEFVNAFALPPGAVGTVDLKQSLLVRDQPIAIQQRANLRGAAPCQCSADVRGRPAVCTAAWGCVCCIGARLYAACQSRNCSRLACPQRVRRALGLLQLPRSRVLLLLAEWWMRQPLHALLGAPLASKSQAVCRWLGEEAIIVLRECAPAGDSEGALTAALAQAFSPLVSACHSAAQLEHALLLAHAAAAAMHNLLPSAASRASASVHNATSGAHPGDNKAAGGGTGKGTAATAGNARRSTEQVSATDAPLSGASLSEQEAASIAECAQDWWRTAQLVRLSLLCATTLEHEGQVTVAALSEVRSPRVPLVMLALS